MAAVIVKGGSILSVGFNRKCDHTQAFYGTSVHAELDALRKGRPPLEQAKMFVYRFHGPELDELRNSKPCESCQQEIKKARLGKVIYLDDNNAVRKASFRNIPAMPRPEMKHLAFGGIAGIY